MATLQDYINQALARNNGGRGSVQDPNGLDTRMDGEQAMVRNSRGDGPSEVRLDGPLALNRHFRMAQTGEFSAHERL